ncbi:D(2) dopamine receptor isoform X1 [Corvus cornix cornix]|uniref:Dopamine receptor D2 n=2 Tax=Corvidae TaxID=28725 RepID=A0A8C3EQ43_CORMO|nr:PREDICTED: D(2) dopamine receptor isoform X1 [Corvus brachyrhynchos]XP_010402102.1 D(2) dopamine receptor isoform X1 [Corvus cornix cornix]XP_017594045.1 PREDICTED: D(2) dopamine receptor isoform X1 [Corvus brachyrhynchos]XP_017594046.1 PREDICTED: D(2) dopamine receptor isoform X1 [Corvus brachyrhynchos]XP_017594047.1 PREDICTED: D(2) dopamine receptor isoform X1 [Corvus brachyrhynchos]XP_031989729.1 D(2) dopamine receptor isoform X1 [Corvus moneduloides]XP_031989730.1 D(2) dopamine recepto
MDPLNLSWYDGDRNWSRALNASDAAQKPHYNYYAVLLTLLIFVIVFGNVLVCMAVSRERALQTTTNYLIVSLAVADLLVATLVMPWVVYLEVVGEWRFSRIHCDIFVTLDVMMCTASILNLCAISIDRYTAVAMPMLYNTRYSSKRRVTVMIAVVWVLSFAISCPLLFGLNNTDEKECIIANPAFVVYSSIVSFYVPFIVTLLVYVQIYIVLRRRRKRVSTKRSSHVLDSDTQAPLKDKCTHPEDVKLCTVIVKSNGSFQVNKRKVEAESHIEEMEMEMVSSTSPPEKTALKPTAPSNHQLIVPVASNRGNNSTLQAPLNSPGKVEKNGHAKESHHTAKVFEIHSLPNGKTRNLLKAVIRRKLSQQKEKKATQMLAIVLGVFIICWLPFFITHILNMHCDCNIPPAMYSAFTWLGYVNSAVNPIIYTTFNIEFRKAFMKILHC